MLFLMMTFLLTADGLAQDYAWPAPRDLPVNPSLPNPFAKLDGHGAGPTCLKEWPAHREYLKEMMQEYLYGHVPPRPDRDELSFALTSDQEHRVDGSSIVGRLQTYGITITRNGESETFAVDVYRPGEEKRYPTIISSRGNRGVQYAWPRGYMFVNFNHNDLVPRDPEEALKRDSGLFRIYPNYNWGAIAARGWFYGVVIDLLDSVELVDMDKIVATGHSRGGQTAFAAAVFDERIDVAAPSTGGFWALGSHRPT